MKAFRTQASKRLFKKLSALRATLSNEERAILDNIMGVDEVVAHKLISKPAAKASQKTAPKASLKNAEVAAHKLVSKPAAKASQKAANKAALKTAEVAAHKLISKPAAKASQKTQPKTTYRIAFDPISEEYKLQE